MSLQREAQQAIRDSVNSEDGAVRLKTAIWIIEKLGKMNPGETDPIKIIRSECNDGFELDFGFNQRKFEKLLIENKLPEATEF